MALTDSISSECTVYRPPNFNTARAIAGRLVVYRVGVPVTRERMDFGHASAR